MSEQVIFDGTIVKNDYGTIRYRNRDGQLHREAGPAVEWVDADGTYRFEFWICGKKMGEFISTKGWKE